MHRSSLVIKTISIPSAAVPLAVKKATIFLITYLHNSNDLKMSHFKLVCRSWKSFFEDINTTFPITRGIYSGLYPDVLLEILLSNNTQVISKDTAREIDNLKFFGGYQTYREMNIFISQYDTRLWKYMTLPDIQKVNSYNSESSRTLFCGLAVIGTPCSFSYFYDLFKRCDEVPRFSSDLFDHLAKNRKMDTKFIRWVIRERPFGVRITMSGVSNLIKGREFPQEDIRELVTHSEKYSIIVGEDHRGFSNRHCSQDLMIAMACTTYFWLAQEDNFQEQDRDEYRYYHRIALNKDVSMHLIWALDAAFNHEHTDKKGYIRAIEFVYFIDEVIGQDSDIKPYGIYSCYYHYASTRPYNFIKYRG